jgi:hypothetical protein
MTIPSQDLKRCSKCGIEKPYDDFYKQHSFNAKSKYTSVMAECKLCTRKRSHDRKYGEKYDQLREQENTYNRKKRQRIKEAVFAAYGGYVCACCGETEKSFLTIDHINNDGAAHRRSITGKRHSAGVHTYNWIVKNGFPEGFQVLCMNCNHGKRMNNGICPHQVRRNDQSKDVGSSDPKRIAPDLHIVRGEDMVCSV